MGVHYINSSTSVNVWSFHEKIKNGNNRKGNFMFRTLYARWLQIYISRPGLSPELQIHITNVYWMASAGRLGGCSNATVKTKLLTCSSSVFLTSVNNSVLPVTQTKKLWDSHLLTFSDYWKVYQFCFWNTMTSDHTAPPSLPTSFKPSFLDWITAVA